MKDKLKIPPQPQRYEQIKTETYPSYVLAQRAFNRLIDIKRKRIRRRADGTFDLVTYKRVKSRSTTPA